MTLLEVRTEIRPPWWSRVFGGRGTSQSKQVLLYYTSKFSLQVTKHHQIEVVRRRISFAKIDRMRQLRQVEATDVAVVAAIGEDPKQGHSNDGKQPVIDHRNPILGVVRLVVATNRTATLPKT